eukprot:Pgem_evm1s4545
MILKSNDPWFVLEIPRADRFKINEEQLKKHYHKLCRIWHPDKNMGNNPEHTNRFQKISWAYDQLSKTYFRKF